jgi:hypothetical protein
MGLTAVLLLAATGGCASDEAGVPGTTALLPFASSSAPITASVDIVIVSEVIACVINSYETHIHCVDRSSDSVTVFGREGEGPGEFVSLSGIWRSRDGHVVAMDLAQERLTFFTPDGTLVSETRLPDAFQPRLLRGDQLFGIKMGIRFVDDELLPEYVSMAVDAYSGEILWERTDLADAVKSECFNEAVGTSTPNGGLVYQACEHELAFFAHRDAPTATVVASPSYVETLPNERDVSAYVNVISSLSRHPGGMSASEIETMAAEFREKPKEWLLKPNSFDFDDQNRLWTATTRDRDTFSYFDIWSGTKFSGAVRIRDRLMGFDIFGSTLATLVDRPPDEDGISELAIDWYDLSEME